MDEQKVVVTVPKAAPTMAERVAWVLGLVVTFASTYAYNRPATPEPVHQAETPAIAPQTPTTAATPATRPALVAPVLEEKPVIRVDTLLIEAKEVKLVGAVTVQTPEIKLPAVYVKNELPKEITDALLKQPVVQVINPTPPPTEAPAPKPLPAPITEPRAAVVVDPPIPPYIKAPAPRTWPARRE